MIIRAFGAFGAVSLSRTSHCVTTSSSLDKQGLPSGNLQISSHDLPFGVVTVLPAQPSRTLASISLDKCVFGFQAARATTSSSLDKNVCLASLTLASGLTLAEKYPSGLEPGVQL
jgi:hypothetical protein